MDDQKLYHPELKKKLEEMSKRHDFILANQDDLERLSADGIVIDEAIDFLSGLFEARKMRAHQILATKSLEFPRPSTEFVELNALIKEIYEAAFFGLYHGAIVLCGSMVEYAVKLMIYAHEHNTSSYDPVKWGPYEKLPLEKAIAKAVNMKILNRTGRKELNWYKDKIRNPYVHYNLASITKGSYFYNAVKLNMATLEEETEQTLYAEDDKTVQHLIKTHIDKQKVFEIIRGSLTLMYKAMASLEIRLEMVSIDVLLLFTLLTGGNIEWTVSLKWLRQEANSQ